MDTHPDDRTAESAIDADLNPAPPAHPGMTEPRTRSEAPAPDAAPMTEAAGVPGYAPLGGAMQPLAGGAAPPALSGRAPRDAAVDESPAPPVTPASQAERLTPRAGDPLDGSPDAPAREEAAASR